MMATKHCLVLILSAPDDVVRFFGPIRTSGSIASTLNLHSLTGIMKGPAGSYVIFLQIWPYSNHRAIEYAPEATTEFLLVMVQYKDKGNQLQGNLIIPFGCYKAFFATW